MANRSSDRRTYGAGLQACATVALLLVPILGTAQQLPLPPGQPDRARTEALARRAGERLQALTREAERLAAEGRTLLGELRKLEVERQIKVEQLREIETEADQVRAELDSITARIATLEERDLSERPDLRARLVETYKLGQGRHLRMLLSTADLRRIGQAARVVAVMAKIDRDRIAAHRQTLADLKSSRVTLEERQRRVAVLQKEAARAQAAAARAVETRNALIRSIEERRDLNLQLAGELQAAQAKLQLSLRDLSAGATDATALPLRPFRGALEWPAAGAVRRPFNRTAGARGATANGIEIAATEGGAVQAVHEGIVAFADTFAGFGTLVILDHGSRSFSLYGNLLDVAVAKGDRIEAGRTVGRVGLSPTGAAGLYFEMRVDGQPVDPLQWLKRR
jgi:septal ring factor EnvC (AmiA/AmiB activator)